MSEFCGDDFVVYMGSESGYQALTMAEILPAGFKASEHMKL
jgi:cytidine deaminase